MWNKIKFYLGMKCVAQYCDGWVATKRVLFVRGCLDKTGDGYLWVVPDYIKSHCIVPSREDAEKLLMDSGFRP